MRKFLLAAAAMLSMTTSTFAAIGDLAADLVFTPITPCRIVDTRNAGGVIPTASSRIFKGVAANYTAQGGSATNCGLPAGDAIAALAVNLLVIVPAAEGWIAAWPGGTAMPLVSNLNYKANDVLANSAILKINQTTNDFNVYTVATTHLAVDVTGYYSRPVATALQTTSSSASLGVAASATFALSSTACPTGYAVTGAGYNENSNFDGMAIWQITPRTAQNDALCRGRNPTASSANVTCTALCSRIPGR